MEKKKHTGIVVPMVTPFTPKGELDEVAVRRLVDFLIEGGVNGIFVLGTTGEAASIPLRVRRRLVQTTVEHVNRRAMVYVGIGDNCVRHSIDMATESLRLGADAVVAHLASYYLLSPREMLDYYTLLAEEIKGPLVIYNMPPTTHMSIPVETIVKLSSHPRIVALKDSENDASRMEGIVQRLKGRTDFSLLMGSSILTARALQMGMDGAVPSSANLCPERWCDLYRTAISHDDRAREIHSYLSNVSKVLQQDRTLGQSVAALKAAMSLRGLCEPNVLPPLHPMTNEQTQRIKDDLTSLKLI